MPKKPLQDIVPKPSIPRRVAREEKNEVEIPRVSSVRRTEEVKKVRESQPEVSTDPHVSVYTSSPRKESRGASAPIETYTGNVRRSPKKRLPWLAAGGAVIGIVLVVGLLLSFVFSGASITVHPRHQEAFVNGDFIATQENVPGQLQFKTTALEKVASREVPATKSEDVNERATGKITIYNNFDDKPQRLITNTRFESKDGKVFRIRDSVTVPGKKTNADGTASPGSIEATVTADEPGEAYNIPPTEFKIPGFEGTPRYDGFYASSKDPMVGGFQGKRNTIEDAQLASIQNELETSLKAELTAQAQRPDQMPDGYYAFDKAYFYQFEALPLENNGDNVKIQVKGVLHNVLFDQKQFAQHLASAGIAGYDNMSIALENPADIKVSVAAIDQDLEEETPWQDTTIRVHVEGTGKFVWQFDEEQLKNDLAGKEKVALPTILAGYPSIEKAEVAVRPFWNSSFPDDVKKITVTKSLD